MAIPTILVAGATIKGILNILGNRVQDTIRDLRNAGVDLEVEGGQQLIQVIETAKNASNEVLNQTLEKVDDVFRQWLESLEQVVIGFETRNYTNIERLITRVQNIANTIPFSNKKPQLIEIRPKYLHISDRTGHTIVQAHGNFPNVQDYVARLTIGSRAITAQHKTVGIVEFSMPNNAFSIAKQDRILNQAGELTLVKRRPFGEERNLFNISMRMLPPSPGRITLETVLVNQRQVTQQFISEPHVQISSSDKHCKYTSDDHRLDTRTVTYSEQPTEGWFVKKGTSKLEYTKPSSGRVSIPHSLEQDNLVTYSVLTEVKHGGKGSGKIWFKITFQEYQTITDRTPQSENYDLDWGQRIDKQLPSREWKIIYTGFDGSRSEFSDTVLNHPYITIHNLGKSLIIQMKKPSDLQVA